MMGSRQVAQGALFYEFSFEDHVPQDHLIRAIDRFVDLSGIRQHLAPFYSNTGRPSVDPELMIRMLLIGYPSLMTQRSPFRYFKTSPVIIRLAVMLYIRFPLSLRNVEDLLHERGIEISHETVRYWWNRFGPIFAAEIRKKRVDRMSQCRKWKWHLDEMYVKINGEMHYLWRAVDHDGEVLESYVTKTRDRKAALKFLKKAMRRHGRPETIVTDKLRSYGAALKDLGRGDDREIARWANNRAENSHLPFRRRERAMLRFRRMRSLQKFATVHASVCNHFNQERMLTSRDRYKANRAAALAEWRGLLVA